MLKKYVGGLTLLVFTFTFVVPLFVGVNTADAGPTSIVKQVWRTNFYCPDGSYATSSSGTDILSESYENHPPEQCGWVPITGGDYNPNNDGVKWMCFHDDEHGEDVSYSDEEDVTSVTLRDNRHSKCQEDDEDEETTN